MMYQKVPVLVDAFQLTSDVDFIAPDWFVQAVADGRIFIDRSQVDGHIHIYGCTIENPEGRLKAKLGDYIIRGVHGEIYPCKADIFLKTYDPVP